MDLKNLTSNSLIRYFLKLKTVAINYEDVSKKLYDAMQFRERRINFKVETTAYSKLI